MAILLDSGWNYFNDRIMRSFHAGSFCKAAAACAAVVELRTPLRSLCGSH
jgi:hypothetical protein